MKAPWRPFASHHLWSLFSPSVGQEHLHCSMKRGFLKARKKEPEIAALIGRNSVAQEIGLLAQYGVYEFQRDEQLLVLPDGVSQVASLIYLNQQLPEVQSRVLQILENYCSAPVLKGKEILHLLRGDEGVPTPVCISQHGYKFNLFVAFDCVFREPDGTIHILDFKTGKSSFDKRQAYVYLLAARYLYPSCKTVASFYNLESGARSSRITATSSQLEAVQIELTQIAQQHWQDLRRYRQHPQNFSTIFPPSSGYSCRLCMFNSVCNFSQ
ncbi:MAG: PD-(D/E)XK nuclease family protein [Leptolyngbya sp. SIO1E4]|nr:PD-(D/E)XK nuclease family protein [Leptolyngbya sp. SIO1E4]